MKRGLGLAVMLMLAVTATPAQAAVILNGPSGSGTLANVGDAVTVNFTGSSGGVTATGLTSSLLLTLMSQSATQTVFRFTLTNTSSSPITSSRVSTFGFNVDPNVDSASVTNIIFDGVASGSIANGRTVEVCFTPKTSCAGGGGEGVGMHSSTTGMFTLNFLGGASDITLSNFAVRYQSIAGAGRITSATGAMSTMVISPVPEPATWAMMLLGFGLIGMAMRRRGAEALRPLAA